MPKTFIIIPVHNEQRSVALVIKAVRKQGFNNIIVVDDGSVDDSVKLVQKSGARLITHAINRGKGAATKTGIDAALVLGADYLITMDGDGQHDPHDIPKLLSPLSRGFDVVLGYRTFSLMPFMKKIANILSNIFTGLLYGIWAKDSMCGFKGYTAGAARTIDPHQDDYEFENEIIAEIARHQLRFSQVPVRTIYTNYSSHKSTRLDLPHAAKIVYKLLFTP